MYSNIDQAILSLLTANKDITVANALPAYMSVAGFTGLCDDAIISFERALEKYPVSASRERVASMKDISKLRKMYWLDKWGITEADVYACGNLRCPCREFLEPDVGNENGEERFRKRRSPKKRSSEFSPIGF